MIRLSPVIDDRLCVIYISQTFARWHDGVARPRWADHWLQEYGPLTEQEASAAEALRGYLRESGCVLLKEAAQQNSGIGKEILSAFGDLRSRSETIFRDAKPDLIRWAGRMEDNPPEFFPKVSAELDRFFGAKDDYELRVYLLPGPPGSNCGNGDMFVEKEATTLACSGMPIDNDAVFLVLLHEAAHSVHQRQVLDALVARVLNSAYGQKISGMFRQSPVCGILGDNIPSYVGELVIHSLVPHGALREQCGLPPSEAYWRSRLEEARRLLHSAKTGWGDVYTAWVTAACAEMVPLGKEYVNEKKQIDEAFVVAALSAFENIYSDWKQKT